LSALRSVGHRRAKRILRPMDRFLKRKATAEATGAEERASAAPPREPVVVYRGHESSLFFREDPLSRADRSVAVAAFDIDGTLQVPRNPTAKPWQTAPDAFRLFDATIPEALQRLHSAGFRIVLFSNQSTLKGAIPNGVMPPAFDKVSASNLRRRLDLLRDALGVPFDAFCATQPTKADKHGFRKPQPGMWGFMAGRHARAGAGAPSAPRSFFVGDAAGRSGDHSADDVGFARSAGLRFYTPERFFHEDGLEHALGLEAEHAHAQTKTRAGDEEGGGAAEASPDEEEAYDPELDKTPPREENAIEEVDLT